MARPPKYAKRRKSCPFSEAKAVHIDYKDVALLKKFINAETGKLLPARTTGVKARYQRMLELGPAARNLVGGQLATGRILATA